MSAAVEAPAGGAAGELRLGDVLAASRRRWLVLAVAAGLGAVAGLVATLFARPSYEAEAKVLIQEDSGLPSSLSGLAGLPGLSTLTGGSAAVAAEIERIRSRSLLRRVLLGEDATVADDDVLLPVVLDLLDASVLASLRVKLGLDDAPPDDASAGLELEVQRWGYAPEDSPLFRLTFRDDGRVALALERLFDRREVVLDWTPGAPLEYERAVLVPRPVGDLTGRTFLVGARTLRQAVDDLLDVLVVEERTRGSNVLGITYYGPAPEAAAALVNRLVDAFVASRESLSRTEANRSIAYLTSELERLDEALVAAELEATRWASEAGPIALPEQARALVEGSTDALVEARTARYTADGLERLLRRIEAGEVGEPELAGLEQAQLLEGGAVEPLAVLVARREALRATYNDAFPELAEVIAEIDTRLAGVAATLAGRIDAERRAAEDLGRVLADFDAQLAELPDVQLEYARHERELETLGQIRTFFQGQLEDARLRLAATTPNAEVLDHAVVPRFRDRPSVKLNLGIGLLVGLALGVALGIVLELRRPVVAAARLSEMAGAPVLAVLRSRRWQRWLPARDQPDGRAADDVRELRLALLQGAGDARSLAFASARRGEGRTRTAANLAYALVASGERVLLVDADARGHRLTRRLGLTAGRDDVTTFAAAEPAARARSAGVDELDVLSLGGDLSLADQVDGGSAAGFLETAASRWDRVLFDVPPLGRAADALAVCRLADGVVLVARAGRVGEVELREAVAKLRRVGARVVGVVLNGS